MFWQICRRPNPPKHAKRFYIKTSGCQMNDADSKVMERLLEREGDRKTGSLEEADVIILNQND